MRKSYVIQWKSNVNGRAGKGTKQFPREETEQLVDELNQEYPDIHHVLVESEQGPPPGPALRETESEEHDTEAEPNRSPVLALSER